MRCALYLGLAVVTVVGACSTFGVTEPGDGGSSPPPPPPPGTDGGAGADSSPPLASNGRICATSTGSDVLFCSDFENPDGGNFGWANRQEQLATFDIESGGGVGNSAGLHLTTDGVNSWLYQGLGNIPMVERYSTYEIELSFRVIENQREQVGIGALWINKPQGGAPALVGIKLRDDSNHVSGHEDTDPKQAISPGWHRAQVSIVATGTPGTYVRRTRIDDQAPAVSEISLAGHSYPDVRIGAFYALNGSAPVNVYFDDVIVRAR